MGPESSFLVPAIMIDDKHQGKGYGKAAMEALIQFKSVSNCTRIMIDTATRSSNCGKYVYFKSVNKLHGLPAGAGSLYNVFQII